MGAPLYSDSRVSQELGVVTDAMLDYSKSFNVGLDVALRVTRQMRDEYEARIAELEGELAEQWTPVPDGEYQTLTPMRLSVHSSGLNLLFGGGYIAMAKLPDNVRLCSKPKESE